MVNLVAVNAWLGLYGSSLAGVVLGELPTAFDEEARDYYSTLAAHVRSFGKLVALDAPASGLDCRAAALADVVSGFKGSYRAWLTARGDGSLLPPVCGGDEPAPYYAGAITR
jgi:hypothetical protein